jgi:hypothetical protein
LSLCWKIRFLILIFSGQCLGSELSIRVLRCVEMFEKFSFTAHNLCDEDKQTEFEIESWLTRIETCSFTYYLLKSCNVDSFSMRLSDFIVWLSCHDDYTWFCWIIYVYADWSNIDLFLWNPGIHKSNVPYDN